MACAAWLLGNGEAPQPRDRAQWIRVGSDGTVAMLTCLVWWEARGFAIHANGFRRRA